MESILKFWGKRGRKSSVSSAPPGFTEAELKAAKKLQAIWRGYKARKLAEGMRLVKHRQTIRKLFLLSQTDQQIKSMVDDQNQSEEMKKKFQEMREEQERTRQALQRQINTFEQAKVNRQVRVAKQLGRSPPTVSFNLSSTPPHQQLLAPLESPKIKPIENFPVESSAKTPPIPILKSKKSPLLLVDQSPPLRPPPYPEILKFLTPSPPPLPPIALGGTPPQISDQLRRNSASQSQSQLGVDGLTEREIAAVRKVQALWRGYKTRKFLEVVRKARHKQAVRQLMAMAEAEKKLKTLEQTLSKTKHANPQVLQKFQSMKADFETKKMQMGMEMHVIQKARTNRQGRIAQQLGLPLPEGYTPPPPRRQQPTPPPPPLVPPEPEIPKPETIPLPPSPPPSPPPIPLPLEPEPELPPLVRPPTPVFNFQSPPSPSPTPQATNIVVPPEILQKYSPPITIFSIHSTSREQVKTSRPSSASHVPQDILSSAVENERYVADLHESWEVLDLSNQDFREDSLGDNDSLMGQLNSAREIMKDCFDEPLMTVPRFLVIKSVNSAEYFEKGLKIPDTKQRKRVFPELPKYQTPQKGSSRGTHSSSSNSSVRSFESSSLPDESLLSISPEDFWALQRPQANATKAAFSLYKHSSQLRTQRAPSVANKNFHESLGIPPRSRAMTPVPQKTISRVSSSLPSSELRPKTAVGNIGIRAEIPPNRNFENFTSDQQPRPRSRSLSTTSTTSTRLARGGVGVSTPQFRASFLPNVQSRPPIPVARKSFF